MAFSVGRLDRLDRQAIRASVLERFSAERMTNDYLAVYRAMLDHMGRGVEPRLAASAARDRWAAASATDGPESEARQPALRTINAPIEAAASRRPD